MNKWVIAMMVILILFVLMLVAAENVVPNGQARVFVYPAITTPSPMFGNNPEVEYAAAQATLVSGKGEMAELFHQATLVSMNMEQAASAAAQSTADYHQSQLMELSYQATVVSLNMVQAAATQQFITEQTQVAWNAVSTAQSQAATATYSTYMFNIIQTAQAQAIQDVQTTQTAQAIAAQRAESLTATPRAAIQADIVRSRNEAERRASWDEFVVTPLKVILLTLVVLLLITGGVKAYQRLMPVLELRLRTISHRHDNPLLLVDGMIEDSDSHLRPLSPGESLQAYPFQFSSDNAVQVEIVGSSEPSITNWITEAEAKLRTDGRKKHL
jgi:di/tricarboxylate transporter